MSIIGILVVLVVVGVLLWALQFVPMDDKIRNVVKVIAIVAAVLWVIANIFGSGSLGPLNHVFKI